MMHTVSKAKMTILHMQNDQISEGIFRYTRRQTQGPRVLEYEWETFFVRLGELVISCTSMNSGHALMGHRAYAAAELTAPDEIPNEAATLSQAATA